MRTVWTLQSNTKLHSKCMPTGKAGLEMNDIVYYWLFTLIKTSELNCIFIQHCPGRKRIRSALNKKEEQKRWGRAGSAGEFAESKINVSLLRMFAPHSHLLGGWWGCFLSLPSDSFKTKAAHETWSPFFSHPPVDAASRCPNFLRSNGIRRFSEISQSRLNTVLKHLGKEKHIFRIG